MMERFFTDGDHQLIHYKSELKMKRMLEKNKRKEFEKNLRWRFSGSTVKVAGRVVIKKGKILDQGWWKRKVERAWKDRNKYISNLRD